MKKMKNNAIVGNIGHFDNEIDMAALAKTPGVERHVVCIADTGLGIPADQKEHIFEEFYQLGNPERDRTKGLGLGLAIVRRLSRMLDITIELQSTPGAGTRFALHLPAVQAPAVPAATPGVPAETGTLRVLVIHCWHCLPPDSPVGRR